MPQTSSNYARYVLAVLVVVYVFNFLDRQILSILAEHVKRDLHLTDAEMGYLYGTAFAVFYAVFGLPLARLSDVWDRRKVIAGGLALWSAMTALCGLARTFPQLALARIGVGVGEASASPAAYSLLSDYFPPARRATVLALYSSGIYIGIGLGLGLGGQVVDRWNRAFPTAPPFGLQGWQVAFLAVGLPGLGLAAWVATLREPPRGGVESVEAHPWRAFGRELRAVLPPLTVLNLVALGAGPGVLAANLGTAAVLAAAAWALTALLGNAVQWTSLALGLYATASWAQSMQLRDPRAFEAIFRTRALLLTALTCGLLSFTGYAYGFWTAPYLVRRFGADVGEVGLALGLIAAGGGWTGVTVGGLLADRLRRRWQTGRLQVAMLNALLPIPAALAMLAAPDLQAALVLNVLVYVSTSLWLGPGSATVQDLVPADLRASASAVFLLVITFVGLALGPYTVGRLSVAFGDLRTALQLCLLANLAALLCALAAAKALRPPPPSPAR